MAITTALCRSFKLELLSATHDFENDTIMMALYTDEASLGPDTTAYTTSGELEAAGYTAGGVEVEVVAGYPAISGERAEVRFSAAEWEGVTGTYRGFMLYNASKSNRAIAVFDRGMNKTVTSGPISIGAQSPYPPLVYIL